MLILLLGGLQQQFEVGKEFTLALGREAKLKGQAVAVKFQDVKEDSRCPEEATCVWAGNAKIAITLSSSGKESSYELNTMQNKKKVVYEGMEVELLRLQPYPKKGKEGV